MRRKGFEISPSPFGVQRVERQRTFAAATDSGEHDQPVAWQVDIDSAQVVGPRSPHANDPEWPFALRQ
jgi:hypothetical protein